MAEVFKSYRKKSRDVDWGQTGDEKAGLCLEQIQAGCFLRIADATEKMAENYSGLIHERDYYKRRTEELIAETKGLRRRIGGLRGYINYLEKKNSHD